MSSDVFAQSLINCVLLTDFTSVHCPLSASARGYELGLMRSVTPEQRWGVSATADPGTDPAVKNGWLPLSPDGLWEISSISVISHAHQQLLVTVPVRWPSVRRRGNPAGGGDR